MTPASCIQTKTTAENILVAPCVASAGIVSGSGHAGALLAEPLLHHPSVRLTHMSSETLTGEPVNQHLPRGRAGLECCSEADVEGVDVASTNYCRIFLHVDLRSGHIFVISVTAPQGFATAGVATVFFSALRHDYATLDAEYST